ncbi:MAG TPA: hypothetical protein VKA47_02250 [Solirubrobacterales bacterium]|nr:hypothetical protein [Solirubrobacterales bacterium]
MRRAPEVTVREIGALIVGALLVAVIMHWPLILNLGRDIPKDLGDPLAQAYQIAWDGNALAHQPLHFFDANQFWPFADTLAFSDALIGYAPAGLVGDGPHAAVVRYDLMFLFAYALAFVGAYLLARELGLGPGGAAVAGVAFAFAPFRLEQDGHMQVISSGGIPLALALGVRGYRLRRPGWVLTGWVVATWQLLLGFTLGLPFAYLLVAFLLIAAVVWWRRGRPSIDRGLAVATIAGAVLFVGAGIALSRPYVHVADAHPNARRTPADVEAFAAPPWAYLVAPDENLVWGGATEPLRDTLSNVPEETLFPGLAILVLAIAGLGSTAFPRWLRVGLGIAVAIVAVLAMGFRGSGVYGYLWPYRWIYEVLPGWQAIRVPGRLDTFTSLGLALLAGAGLQRMIASRALRRVAPWRGGAAVAAVVVLLVLVEGRGLPFDPFDNQAQPKVPPVPPSTASVPAPQLHLPALRATDNRRYVLWSTDGYPKMVNGRSSLNPAFTASVIRREQGFPDRRGVELLSRLGVRSVVLHTNRVKGTPWQDAARRPIARLPLTRGRRGELVIYELHAPG